MTRILVVDDSEVHRRLAGGLLNNCKEIQADPNFCVEYAENGVQALEQIRRQPPSLVLTDLVMPEMDGLELVRAVRSEHPEVPVVLMTAYGSETTAVDALEQGAASYIPKAHQAERLIETVQRILARAAADRARQKLLGSLAHLECTFVLENDPDLIEPLVNLVQQSLAGLGITDAAGRIRVGVALEEAVLNAMCHGNLELDAEAVAEARTKGFYDGLLRLIRERSSLSSFRERKTRVEVAVTDAGARFVVRDDGAGFNLTTFSRAILPDGFAQGRCRGMLLMRSLMDDVQYTEAGNEVSMVKLPEITPSIRQQPSPPSKV